MSKWRIVAGVLLCIMLFALLAWAIMTTVSLGARQAMMGGHARAELERARLEALLIAAAEPASSRRH